MKMKGNENYKMKNENENYKMKNEKWKLQKPADGIYSVPSFKYMNSRAHHNYAHSLCQEKVAHALLCFFNTVLTGNFVTQWRTSLPLRGSESTTSSFKTNWSQAMRYSLSTWTKTK